MPLKNRKKNYPHYETVHLRDFRDMVENSAKNFGDSYALTAPKTRKNRDADRSDIQMPNA